MKGLESLYGKDRLTINQCQEIAKNIGFNSATFDLHGPKGKLPCVWVDAYMGLFSATEDKVQHLMMVSQVIFSDAWCENIMPAKETRITPDAAQAAKPS